MVDSFASSEDLGFVALSLPTGGSIWLAAASIYAVETQIGEDYSIVKTVGDAALGVTEAPKEIFDRIQEMQANAADRARVREIDEFVEFVTSNELGVMAHPDDVIHLVESDERLKVLRAQGYPIIDEDDVPAVAGKPTAFIDRPDDEVDYESILRERRQAGIED